MSRQPRAKGRQGMGLPSPTCPAQGPGCCCGCWECGRGRPEGHHPAATWTGLTPPGKENLSLLPQVNTCHTTIMMTFNQTEDTKLESKHVQTHNSHKGHQANSQMRKWGSRQESKSTEPPRRPGPFYGLRGPFLAHLLPSHTQRLGVLFHVGTLLEYRGQVLEGFQPLQDQFLLASTPSSLHTATNTLTSRWGTTHR